MVTSQGNSIVVCCARVILYNIILYFWETHSIWESFAFFMPAAGFSCCCYLGVVTPLSYSVVTPLRGAKPQVKGGVDGGCGGKAAKLPAPPTASQRITFMGRGGPEALRCHMSPKGV